MNATLRYREDPAHVREQIAEIVRCRMVEGMCVVHQTREWEPRKRGCPYVDSLMRYAGYRARHDDTGGL